MTILYQIGNKLYLNITNACPCACDFCIRHNKERMGEMQADESLWLEREPTEEEVLSAVEKADLSSYEEAVFCGFGEPTCRLPLLLKTARLIKEKAPTMPVRLNTNGLSDLIWKRKTADEMAGLIDRMNVSLNASDEEKYLAVTHASFGKGSYEAMLQFAKDASKIAEVTVSIVDCIGQEEIEACKKVCEERGLDLRIRPYEE